MQQKIVINIVINLVLKTSSNAKSLISYRFRGIQLFNTKRGVGGRQVVWTEQSRKLLFTRVIMETILYWECLCIMSYHGDTISRSPDHRFNLLMTYITSTPLTPAPNEWGKLLPSRLWQWIYLDFFFKNLHLSFAVVRVFTLTRSWPSVVSLLLVTVVSSEDDADIITRHDTISHSQPPSRNPLSGILPQTSIPTSVQTFLPTSWPEESSSLSHGSPSYH